MLKEDSVILTRQLVSSKEKGYVKGGTKKPTAPKADKFCYGFCKKQNYCKKYGKGAIMSGGSRQQKKVKGAKSTVGTGKYKKAADLRNKLQQTLRRRIQVCSELH